MIVGTGDNLINYYWLIQCGVQVREYRTVQSLSHNTRCLSEDRLPYKSWGHHYPRQKLAHDVSKSETKMKLCNLSQLSERTSTGKKEKLIVVYFLALELFKISWIILQEVFKSPEEADSPRLVTRNRDS